ncbi:MAG: H-NS histone family protein [Boseongicola sp. SB0677_bin_26]|nr:H-NS histone family protein [Boseongicola sp. SB0665_bin_10]MYG26632.1 H-NS histone family protein [Boseongicola sp. SB0677_bin_26]
MADIGSAFGFDQITGAQSPKFGSSMNSEYSELRFEKYICSTVRHDHGGVYAIATKEIGMAAKINLGKLSERELKALKRGIENELKSSRTRTIATATQELQVAAQKIAKKHGLTVNEVLGKKRKYRKSPVPPKYRNPNDPGQTWSGRGRQPAWFREARDKGKSASSLEI